MTRVIGGICIVVGLTMGAIAAKQQQAGQKKQVSWSRLTPDEMRLNAKALPKEIKADFVFVDKSERKMYLKKNGKVLRVYHIALGESPKGHKVQEGDEKTPEGTYVLDWKNENSIAHRSIHISYPNAKDKAHAKKLGVSAGGNIMIHGQMNGYGHLAPMMQLRDWTDGCVAVTDNEMDEVMSLVKVGTKIKIVW